MGWGGGAVVDDTSEDWCKTLTMNLDFTLDLVKTALAEKPYYLWHSRKIKWFGDSLSANEEERITEVLTSVQKVLLNVAFMRVKIYDIYDLRYLR